jgi:DNA-binding IscR family transcriptional regulator
MKTDGRLSAILHALLHIHAVGRPMTSEELARHMNTNPVVVRRTMAGLRRAGLVRSERGRGGGWEIARDLDAVTLRDIHEALGAPAVLSIGVRLEHPACAVEQAVNRALKPAFAEAEALLVEKLGGVTLGTLAAEFAPHLAHHQSKHHV